MITILNPLQKSKLIEDSYASLTSHLLDTILSPLIKSLTPHYDISTKDGVITLIVKSDTDKKANKNSSTGTSPQQLVRFSSTYLGRLR
jgi:hypothetical protein